MNNNNYLENLNIIPEIECSLLFNKKMELCSYTPPDMKIKKETTKKIKDILKIILREENSSSYIKAIYASFSNGLIIVNKFRRWAVISYANKQLNVSFYNTVVKEIINKINRTFIGNICVELKVIKGFSEKEDMVYVDKKLISAWINNGLVDKEEPEGAIELIETLEIVKLVPEPYLKSTIIIPESIMKKLNLKQKIMVKLYPLKEN